MQKCPKRHLPEGIDSRGSCRLGYAESWTNARAGQTGAVTELVFYHLSQGIPFLSRTTIVRFGSEAEVKHPTSG